MNAGENFWNNCFATNQMRDETAKDNCQTAPWISYDFTQDNELAFSSTTNLQFNGFQILKLFFSISAYLYAKNRYKCYVSDILQKSDIELSR